MSLINDALKRAKAAQDNGAAAQTQSPLLRPADTTTTKRSGLGPVVPIAVTLAAIIGLACLRAATGRKTASGATNAAAQENSLVPASRPQAASAQAAQTAPTDSTDRSMGPPRATALATNTPTLSAAVATPAISPETSTNTSARAEPPPPKPAPLRLQAVIFHPTRPSAMIGGKTLAVGDTVGAFRVLAIGRASATLASAGQTNILTLPE